MRDRQDFERYAPAIALFYAGSIAMPVMFGSVVLVGGSPVTPELYGPLVYAVPALVWVAGQLIFASIATIGAGLRMPTVAFIGSAGMTAYLAILATASLMAGATGTLLFSGAGGWVGPISSVAALICWRGRHEHSR